MKKIKIAILGSKGIPNNYGGFEQFAEIFSVFLEKNGIDVTVYNPHEHPFKEKTFKDVKIEHIYCPEKKIGALAHIIYDYLCLRHALRQNFDLILELGYQSVALSYLILPINRSLIVTNMDGLEWKRSKWNYFAKKFIKLTERIAVKRSHSLISDNEGIRKYILDKYDINSSMIPYGADMFRNPKKEVLKKFGLKPKSYYLIISRIEPENNLEMILDGFTDSNSEYPIYIIGNFDNKFGKYLLDKYKDNSLIKFIGAIYDINILNNLRFYSKIYFHGHCVGGTNPSLLEAMSSFAFIAAHDNIFNRNVLNESALFFSNSEKVKEIINSSDSFESQRKIFTNNKKILIDEKYNWNNINRLYLNQLTKLIKS